MHYQIVCVLFSMLCAISNAGPKERVAYANYPAATSYPKPEPLPLNAAEWEQIMEPMMEYEIEKDEETDGIDKEEIVDNKQFELRMSSAVHPETLEVQRASGDNNETSEQKSSKETEKTKSKKVKEERQFFGPIINPASYFLHGAQFEAIKKPECQLINCEGPFPNDGNVRLAKPGPESKEFSTCHRVWIELNSCVADKGYPIGMICTICCQCNEDLVDQMQKSRGFSGFSSLVEQKQAPYFY